MPKHSLRLFGFTLIEILVVVSIIGILGAMGLASFSVAQRQARNARRLGDLKAMQNCLEQHYALSNSTYTGATCNSVSEVKNGHPAYTYSVAANSYTISVTPEVVSSGAVGTAITRTNLQ